VQHGPELDSDLATLAGPQAGDLLAAAVAAMGGELLEWSTTQVDHRPGRSTAAAYRARVRWPDVEQDQTFGARLSARPLPPTDQPGIVLMSDGAAQVQVWRFPADPELPGLAVACHPRSTAELLRTAGLDPVDATCRVVSYRPCRRAVVEITTPTSRLFVKVLRPAVVAEVHRRHLLLRVAGLPTPRSLGWSDNGLLVLEPLAGIRLREALHRHGADACSPDQLLDLLDRLPAELADLPRRAAWSESAGHYAGVLAAADPELGEPAGQVAAAVAAGLDARADDGPVHGDFYEAQLLVSGGHVTGLLDADTVGPGRRLDDLACLVAHLALLVIMAPADSVGARGALADWIGRFDRAVDPYQLRVRAAGVALALATGPYRTQEPAWRSAARERIGLAAQWLDVAGTGGLPDFQKALIGASGSSGRGPRFPGAPTRPSVSPGPVGRRHRYRPESPQRR
jgi:hypothetical protein